MSDEVIIDDLARMSGDTYHFENIGDRIVGTITQVSQPFGRVNKFNDKNETVYAIGITPDGGTQAVIWPVKTENGASPMLQAIVEAVQKVGERGYKIGGKLAVVFTETKDTGKGQPMKVYAAQYKAPATQPAAVNLASDLLS